MKKILLVAATAIVAGSMILSGNTAYEAGAETQTLETNCKAAYLCDYDSGMQVYARNETKRLPIASMCKIMTLLLAFEAVDCGDLAYDEMITVSENASGMGGSQVFLEANLSYEAEELMKSVAVCSANDSCVALAERIAGSESAFVDRMNARAKELGAENTLFANCTGLPKEPQYSCAKDVSAMLREMLKHEKYYEFSKIWLEDFVHPDGRTTSMTNTNKLIRTFNGCDGGKTGFTNEAGFCLAATAKRGDTRIVSVVIGADSSKNRFDSVSALFDYAFGNFENKIVQEAGIIAERANVCGSKKREIAVCAENALSVFCKKGKEGNLTVDIELSDNLKAPVAQGDAIGKAVLYSDGIEICQTRLLAGESAERFTWWEAYREGARNWN